VYRSEELKARKRLVLPVRQQVGREPTHLASTADPVTGALIDERPMLSAQVWLPPQNRVSLFLKML
jgi:hypothetical protein